MSQHYTRDTVAVSAWCKKCGKETMHTVHNKILGPCQVCLKKLNETKKPKAKPVQLDLF
jgi:hypothetical protein